MKRHSLDPLSFVFGLLFTLTGAAFLFGNVNLSTAAGQWEWPALLAGAGILLMVLTARPSRRERGSDPGKGKSTESAEVPAEVGEARPGAAPDEL